MLKPIVALLAASMLTACGGRGGNNDENPLPPGSCRSPADCQVAGETCVRGECAPTSCTDGKSADGESDIDCGGLCPGCSEGQRCQATSDCLSSFCDSSGATAVCRDCERDEDCGAIENAVCLAGTCEAPRPVGQFCDLPGQCASGVCADNVCSCSTASDCGDGGNVCIDQACVDALGNGVACASDDQCASGRCDTTCADKLANGVMGGCDEPSDCAGGKCYISFTGPSYNTCLAVAGAMCASASRVGGPMCDTGPETHGEGSGYCDEDGECEAVCNDGTWLSLEYDCYFEEPF